VTTMGTKACVVSPLSSSLPWKMIRHWTPEVIWSDDAPEFWAQSWILTSLRAGLSPEQASIIQEMRAAQANLGGFLCSSKKWEVTPLPFFFKPRQGDRVWVYVCCVLCVCVCGVCVCVCV
jgi:hypothetical protein